MEILEAFANRDATVWPVNAPGSRGKGIESTSRPLRVLVAALALASALASGCAFFTTQAYDFAQERWRFCQSRFPGVQLERIDPDGLISFQYADTAAASGMQSCLSGAADRQALRVLAPKPPPAIASPLPAE